MKLILAEKPSVAKNIADALHIKTKQDGYFQGNDYLITWAFGHLLQLYDAKDYDRSMTKWKMEKFPFIPEKFLYKVKTDVRNRNRADGGAQKQLQVIKRLMNRPDVEAIVSACDYDREGQLIGDSIINYIKPQQPVYRLLINEWTQAEVLHGLKNMQPNEKLRPLKDAGISRQWADWIIGINLTSVATLKYQQGSGKALNIGRVLLPTLKIIYDRDKEIKSFIPEDYFKLTATFSTNSGGTFQGVYQEKEQEKFKQKQPLEEIAGKIAKKQATIIDKQVEKKKEFPPFLFNLSNLQGYMTNRYNGWTSDKVLKVAQSLYEKKWITYPRTASTALDESLVGKAATVLKKLAEEVPYKEEIRFSKSKRVFNNAKVESHSAIMPTYLKPKRLTKDQELVYQAIKNRFIMQFMPIAEYEETRLFVKIEEPEVPGLFYTKGRVQLKEGWKQVEGIQSKETILPYVEPKETVAVQGSDVSSHVTKPPKPHTEKTLLRLMETCGKVSKEIGQDQEEEVTEVLSGFSIGTPATRAETIKKLKDVGYITTQRKNLVCTELGNRLVETFPIDRLFDLDFTGRLEKSLADIEKGKVDKQRFLETVFTFTKQSVGTIKQEAEVTINKVVQQKASKETLGKCPVCGSKVVEGSKGFGCSNWKSGCKFVVWKNDKYLAAMRKRATKTLVKGLLKNGRVYAKGLTSKKGKKFNAYLSYQKNASNDYFSWKMDFTK
ncbi:type IA DNA topoisomerase [Sediminibacillus halophilus]|uniref:DNA topoisomerase n=1 Tax=Sediminibacillus halophilus TaxID=482461 RepID=A0A1G9N7G0_9BACI|nr:type IA DNA topoisomerase [Sediminibacillus halophilus]SDL82344.1 DNA topoisomerase-3 [Sediminibacillus halophilus]